MDRFLSCSAMDGKRAKARPPRRTTSTQHTPRGVRHRVPQNTAARGMGTTRLVPRLACRTCRIRALPAAANSLGRFERTSQGFRCQNPISQIFFFFFFAFRSSHPTFSSSWMKLSTLTLPTPHEIRRDAV